MTRKKSLSSEGLMQLSLFEPCQSQPSQSAIAFASEKIAQSKSLVSTISSVDRVVNGLRIGNSVEHKSRFIGRMGIVGGFLDAHTETFIMVYFGAFPLYPCIPSDLIKVMGNCDEKKT
jgi:hypothetical protein